MNNSTKIEAEINRLTNIIHHGINQQSTNADLDVFFDKAIGNLPLGANAPIFTSRKRMITLQILFRFIQFTVGFLISAIFAFELIFIALHQDFQLSFLLTGLALLLLSIFFLVKAITRMKVYTIINRIQQIIPDPEKNLPFIDEFAIAQQFSKQRMITRVTGCFIAIIGGAICWHLIFNRPNAVVQIAFIAPFFFMLGIGVIFNPISKAESLHRYGTAQIPWKHIPAFLKLCIIIGVILCIVLLAWYEGFFQFT